MRLCTIARKVVITQNNLRIVVALNQIKLVELIDILIKLEWF